MSIGICSVMVDKIVAVVHGTGGDDAPSGSSSSKNASGFIINVELFTGSEFRRS